MKLRNEELERRLGVIHQRLQWIADSEARAAWVGGYGARGEFLAERERLIARAEKVVDEMEQIASRELHASTFVQNSSGMGRKSLVERRIQRLIANFGHYVNWFDEHVPFDRPNQLESHLATMRLRKDLKTATAAAADLTFCKSLYRTLQSWGIGQRGSHLVPLDAFQKAMASAFSQLRLLKASQSTIRV